MPTIFTHPDFNPSRSTKKVMIKNVTWTNEEIQQYLNELSEKEYEIYLHRPDLKDIQWVEGVRTMCTKIYDFKQCVDKDPVAWLKEIDDAN